jgi:hypothetical protein
MVEYGFQQKKKKAFRQLPSRAAASILFFSINFTPVAGKVKPPI